MIQESLYVFDAQEWAALDGGYLVGVDESGRGPLAGPVVCAAAVLRPDARLDWLNDSKKVTAARRAVLFEQLQDALLASCVVVMEPEDIDRLNILGATMTGMARALKGLCEQLAREQIGLALIDGNRIPADAPVSCRAVIGGDGLSASIAAASILAKVTRDRLMLEYSAAYPEYELERHKGYPTAAHYQAIREFGLTPIHRRSFFKKNEEIMSREETGRLGEQIAADYLAERGFTIEARNFRTRFGEVDIVAVDAAYRVFAEVKTRGRNSLVGGAEAVTAAKQQRVAAAASAYLQECNDSRQPRFDVIEVTHNGDCFTIVSHIENAF